MGLLLVSVTGAAAAGVVPQPIQDRVAVVIGAVTPFNLSDSGDQHAGRTAARSAQRPDWWQTSLWQYAVFAVVIYSRAAAERLGVPLEEIPRRIAARHPFDLRNDGRQR